MGFDPAEPGLKRDLVFANGEGRDRSQALRGNRDLGINNGRVAAILPAIPAAGRYSVSSLTPCYS